MTMDRTSPQTEPLQPAKTLPQNVRLLGWASLLNDIASEAIYPLLPQFLLGLGGSRALLGLLEGLADTVASLLKLWTGAWSDRLGQRKVFVVVGYALAGLSRPCLGLATQIPQVFGIRLLDRIGKGLRTAPRDALITESTVESQRGYAFGFHRAMDHLGAAIGPLLAAAFLWFVPDGLRPLMLLTLIPGLIVIGLQVWGLRETKRPVIASRRTLKSFPTGAFRLYLISLLVFTFANSSDAFLLVRAGELGVTTVWLPILWSFLHMAKSLGNRLAGRLADRWSPRIEPFSNPLFNARTNLSEFHQSVKLTVHRLGRVEEHHLVRRSFRSTPPHLVKRSVHSAPASIQAVTTASSLSASR